MSKDKKPTSPIVITHDSSLRELDVKRFYPPFELKSACPQCGEVCSRGGSDDYLSYPSLNTPISVIFGHEFDEPEWGYHEWTLWVTMGMTVVQVSEPDAPGKD